MLNCKQSVCFSSADNYPLVNISLKYLQHLAPAENLYIKMNVCLGNLGIHGFPQSLSRQAYILTDVTGRLDEDVDNQTIEGSSGFPLLLCVCFCKTEENDYNLGILGVGPQVCDFRYFTNCQARDDSSRSC